MAYTKARYDFAAPSQTSELAKELGLRNLGLSIYRLRRGEGFDFFHNHREQEEVYLCLEGTADLMIAGSAPSRITLERGDIVKVEPGTLRAIGNLSSDEAVVLIAGACPHPYPAGFGHHDVIADVLSVVGQGETGFSWPADLARHAPSMEDEEC